MTKFADLDALAIAHLQALCINSSDASHRLLADKLIGSDPELTREEFGVLDSLLKQQIEGVSRQSKTYYRQLRNLVRDANEHTI